MQTIPHSSVSNAYGVASARLTRMPIFGLWGWRSAPAPAYMQADPGKAGGRSYVTPEVRRCYLWSCFHYFLSDPFLNMVLISERFHRHMGFAQFQGSLAPRTQAHSSCLTLFSCEHLHIFWWEREGGADFSVLIWVYHHHNSQWRSSIRDFLQKRADTLSSVTNMAPVIWPQCTNGKQDELSWASGPFRTVEKEVRKKLFLNYRKYVT